jgi:hypothetical protein
MMDDDDDVQPTSAPKTTSSIPDSHISVCEVCGRNSQSKASSARLMERPWKARENPKQQIHHRAFFLSHKEILL